MSGIIQRGEDEGRMRVVVSPYRICPIGAHSDHQGGPTLGMAVNAHTRLGYERSSSSEVRLSSENYPDEVRFELGDDKELTGWGRYALAAARALGDRLRRGIRGRVSGTLPGGGLSSSASVLVAYLTALADVNEVELSPKETVELALRAEREYVGVKVGILDPAAIVGARREHLLLIDSRETRWEPLALGDHAPPYRILVAFTGITRNLAGTGYNQRVEECLEAAKKLSKLAGIEPVNGLHDFDDTVFQEYERELTPVQALRARHFFTERARVRRGAELWKRGDLEGFGELMNESCGSSIHNWEAGSPELIEVQRVLTETPGVFGSRFSGAGFGGCVVALVAKESAEEARSTVERVIRSQLPQSRVFLVDSDDGVRVL